jgi:hypothetical protein
MCDILSYVEKGKQMGKITPYDGTDPIRRIVAHEDAARAAETLRIAGEGAIGCTSRPVKAQAKRAHVLVRDVHPIERAEHVSPKGRSMMRAIRTSDDVTPGFRALASAQAKIDATTEAQAKAYGYRADDRRVSGELATLTMRIKPGVREHGATFADRLSFKGPAYTAPTSGSRSQRRKAAKSK